VTVIGAPFVFDVRRASRTFSHRGGNVAAVVNTSFTVTAGEFLAIVGPSGSGKSTLLHLMGALDRADSGQVLFNGDDLSQLSEAALTQVRRHQIGFIFQAFNLVPVLSAYENVEYGLWLAGMPKSQRRRTVERALDRVGVLHRRDHRPDHLSGGERQRVAIARALVTDPVVVLADEATANLDSSTAALIVELLLDLNRSSGTVVVFATHDHSIITRVPRVIELADGQITVDRRDPVRTC
jgi:putative ABC transport system ATP-binding protein